MSNFRSALFAALACTALALPMMAQAHCPPGKASVHKTVKKKLVKKVAVKKAATRVVACNCSVVVKKTRQAVSHPAPPAAHPAPAAVDHAPYVDTGAGYADYGPSGVVDLNEEGWESATYTSSRIVSRQIVTYYTLGQGSGSGSGQRLPHPVDCRDPRHRHHG